MPYPTKVCPFCMVDAQTDSDSCAYCGSSYDCVAPATATRTESVHTRLRTYDGVQPCQGAVALSLYVD